MMFADQPMTDDGSLVINAERNIKARFGAPYKSVSFESDEIAQFIIVTHPDWMLMTPVSGRYVDMIKRLVQVGDDNWVPETVRGPNARIELAFASQFGMVSEADENGIYVMPAERDIVPHDIANIVADAARGLWKTQHFELNSGWNAS